MTIKDLFKSEERTYSFEFYPPKDEISAVDFGINVGKLLRMHPSFVSVTYGAGGSNSEKMFALVDYLQNKVGIRTMAHYTCVNASREKVLQDMQDLQSRGIENLMLLRGDTPKSGVEVGEQAFEHANQLISFVKERFDFCIGGASYPQVHPEAPSPEKDLYYLKQKVDSGCDFLITQLFFDNSIYFNFVRKAREAGIKCRIIPGVIPLTKYSQLERFTKFSAASVPQNFLEQLETWKDNPAKIHQIGMDFAVKQCRDLLMMGAPGLHFYTLNKSRATVEVFETLLGNH